MTCYLQYKHLITDVKVTTTYDLILIYNLCSVALEIVILAKRIFWNG